MKQREIIIAEEMAELEFESFLECMDIDFDAAVSTDEGKDNAKAKDTVVKAVMYGDLVFSEGGEPVYTPWRKASKCKDPITFHERTGSVLMASDNKGRNSRARQVYAMMGSMCKVDASTFRGLAGRDIKVCEAIFGLLMG